MNQNEYDSKYLFLNSFVDFMIGKGVKNNNNWRLSHFLHFNLIKDNGIGHWITN